MTVPVGSLGEHFEAAPTWKWLLPGVGSQMVSHGGLFGKAMPTGVTDQPLLEPPSVLAAIPHHLVGGCC